MTWSDIYLGCFFVGFSLSLLSFLAGAVHIHLPFKMHLPFHNWHLGHHGGAGASHGSHAASSNSHGASHLSWFNASTVLAFLAWFGGIGYILTLDSKIIAAVSFVIAVAAGLAASWVVFSFMVRLMNEEGSYLKEEDYRHEGLPGTVSMPIRENGIGEIHFMQAGARKSAGARSHDGKPLELGAEIVIERYEDGIAYVHRWSEFTQLDEHKEIQRLTHD
jgi:membrane protein implicated in regulation of membrane protease activity